MLSSPIESPEQSETILWDSNENVPASLSPSRRQSDPVGPKPKGSKSQAPIDVKLVGISIWETSREEGRSALSYQAVSDRLAKDGYGNWSKVSVMNWINDRESIKEASQKLDPTSSKKRAKVNVSTAFPLVDVAVENWIENQSKFRTSQISGPTIMTAAHEVYQTIRQYAIEGMGKYREDLEFVRRDWPEKFSLTEDGWLRRFKERVGLRKSRASQGSGSSGMGLTGGVGGISSHVGQAIGGKTSVTLRCGGNPEDPYPSSPSSQSYSSSTSNALFQYKEEFHQKILVEEGYEPSCVYSVDEISLYWKMMLSPALDTLVTTQSTATSSLDGLSEEKLKAAGSRPLSSSPSSSPQDSESDDKLLLLLGCNLTGTHRLKLWAIGKQSQPSSLLGRQSELDEMGVVYRSNPEQGWMTGELWIDYVLNSFIPDLQQHRLQINQPLQAKTLLLVDPIHAHSAPRVKEYLGRSLPPWLRVEILPPSLPPSSVLPISSGVSQLFKLFYRLRMLLCLQSDNPPSPAPVSLTVNDWVKGASLYRGLLLMVLAWRDLPSEEIQRISERTLMLSFVTHPTTSSSSSSVSTVSSPTPTPLMSLSQVESSPSPPPSLSEDNPDPLSLSPSLSLPPSLSTIESECQQFLASSLSRFESLMRELGDRGLFTIPSSSSSNPSSSTTTSSSSSQLSLRQAIQEWLDCDAPHNLPPGSVESPLPSSPRDCAYEVLGVQMQSSSSSLSSSSPPSNSFPPNPTAISLSSQALQEKLALSSSSLSSTLSLPPSSDPISSSYPPFLSSPHLSLASLSPVAAGASVGGRRTSRGGETGKRKSLSQSSPPLLSADQLSLSTLPSPPPPPPPHFSPEIVVCAELLHTTETRDEEGNVQYSLPPDMISISSSYPLSFPPPSASDLSNSSSSSSLPLDPSHLTLSYHPSLPPPPSPSQSSPLPPSLNEPVKKKRGRKSASSLPPTPSSLHFLPSSSPSSSQLSFESFPFISSSSPPLSPSPSDDLYSSPYLCSLPSSPHPSLLPLSLPPSSTPSLSDLLSSLSSYNQYSPLPVSLPRDGNSLYRSILPIIQGPEYTSYLSFLSSNPSSSSSSSSLSSSQSLPHPFSSLHSSLRSRVSEFIRSSPSLHSLCRLESTSPSPSLSFDPSSLIHTASSSSSISSSHSSLSYSILSLLSPHSPSSPSPSSPSSSSSIVDLRAYLGRQQREGEEGGEVEVLALEGLLGLPITVFSYLPSLPLPVSVPQDQVPPYCLSIRRGRSREGEGTGSGEGTQEREGGREVCLLLTQDDPLSQPHYSLLSQPTLQPTP